MRPQASDQMMNSGAGTPDRAAIVDHEIGARALDVIGQLERPDMPQFQGVHSRPREHATGLLPRRRRYHGDGVDLAPALLLEQQRNVEDHEGACAVTPQKEPPRLGKRGMDDPFQPAERRFQITR